MPPSRNKQRKYHKASSLKSGTETIDADSVVVRAFQEMGKELDSKHDKYERIVKISRDITIESKRIIFGLQALCRSNDLQNESKKLHDGLNKITSVHFKNIAGELQNEDPYQYLRAYSPGLQEFIEAITLYHYIIYGQLYSWNQLKEDFVFEVDVPNVETDGAMSAEDECNESSSSCKKLITTLPLTDYVAGLQDLTGELMRLCINSFASGKLSNGFSTCNFVRTLHIGMLLIGGIPMKEFGRKMFVLKQSLIKMETACYMMHVRGSEILTHMLPEVVDERQEEYENDDYF